MNYNDFKKTEFYKFFNLNKTKTSIKDDMTEIYFKTGGFQEFIDIIILINKNNDIIEAKLIIEREWIGNIKNINPFGKDIVKSFISVFTPLNDKNKINKIIETIWNLKGENDYILYIKGPEKKQHKLNEKEQKVIDVYLNLIPFTEFKLKSSTFLFRNIKINKSVKFNIIWKINSK
ncbi:MAG: hypothetical protein ACTSWR_12090 [Candidatus Helarchaeota archaeon]